MCAMARNNSRYDKTQTKRSAAHMERLIGSNGGRVTVDFDEDGQNQLAELKESGFGINKSEIIRRAVKEAHGKLKKSS
jgi:hypothetical protein